MKDASVLFNDKLTSYEELLKKDGSVSNHHKNIQSLAIEMFQKRNYKFPPQFQNRNPLSGYHKVVHAETLQAMY